MLREALNQADLVERQRGSARRNHVVHPTLVHADHVGVAFDQVHFIGAADRLLGLKKAIENLGLVVNI